MKTIQKTGPLLIAAKTDKLTSVPKGKVHVIFVRYETQEYDADEFDVLRFEIHDSNRIEARIIADLVNGGNK